MTAAHGPIDAPHSRLDREGGAGLDRRGLLRGAVAAGTLGLGLASGISLSPAAQAASAPKALDPKQFTLTSHDTKTADLADALLKEAGSADIAAVMKAANHDRTEAHVIDGQAHGFVWEDSEQKDETWYPQGITSTRDAVGTKDNGRYQDHQLLAVSFYRKEPAWSRINLVDWDATMPNRYRRILLVEPTGTVDKPSFTDVDIHVGGISWYGDYLYVADTGSGLRVFDMTRILRTDASGDMDEIGRVGDRFSAHHHSFALPQIGTITANDPTGDEDPLLWSTISLDRPKKSIVVTEYRVTEEGGQFPTGTTRAVRFPFAKDSTRFAEKTTATEALAVPLHFLNGVGSHNGRWWFNDSHNKRLHYWSGSGAMSDEPWVSWGESLSYWEDEDGPDLLWCLQEGVGNRTVFAVEQGDYS